MFDKIIAFFMSIIAFFMGLFGGGGSNPEKPVTPPSEPSSSYTRYEDVSYGSHERQKLDVCFPAEHDGEVGLFLLIHGGAWIEGDKDSCTETATVAARDFGLVGAAINYHYISDSVHMDTLMNDIDLALAKIKEMGAEKGINVNKVMFMGFSAGAHMSLLYAYSKAETAPIKPVAVVSCAGPTDFTDESFYINNDIGNSETMAALFSWAGGKPFIYADRAKPEIKASLEAISPLSYVNASTVPTILNHGDKDTIVPYSNAVSLDAKLTEYGVPHHFNTYRNDGHGLGNDKATDDVAYTHLIEYINTYLK